MAEGTGLREKTKEECTGSERNVSQVVWWAFFLKATKLGVTDLVNLGARQIHGFGEADAR